MSFLLETILEIMNEKGITIKDLEENKVIGKNTIYSFNKSIPSLKTFVKISNFLQTNIAYLVGLSNYKYYVEYDLENLNFYNNLMVILQKEKISQSKLCKDLKISRSNFSRWKNGTNPSINKLIEIASYLYCGIDDLLSHK